jgi:hypothetical protein
LVPHPFTSAPGLQNFPLQHPPQLIVVQSCAHRGGMPSTWVPGLHAKEHVLPLQTCVPPEGAAGQSVLHAVPQEFVVNGDWHSFPHVSVLAGHAQWPL